MRRKTNKQRHFHVVARRYRDVAVVFFGVLFLVIFISAQELGVPNPPPDDTTITGFTSASDFVLRDGVGVQTLDSAFVAASSTTSFLTPAAAFFGNFAGNASLGGYAGYTTPDFILTNNPSGLGGAALYGYAEGGAINVGAYGYAKASLATGILANGSGSVSSVTFTDFSTWSGEGNDIAIGTDGFPIVSLSYSFGVYPGPAQVVGHCQDKGCSAFDPTPATPLNNPINGRFSAIAIGTDGFPVVTYWTESGTKLWVAHCTNVKCTTFDAPNTVYTLTAGNNSPMPDIAIGTDGFPVISFYVYVGANDGSLRMAHCANKECTGAISSVELDTGRFTGASFETGRHSSIAISGLYPVISYYDDNGDDLTFIRCTSYDCSSHLAEVDVDAVGSVGKYTSIAINPATGFPMISYYDSSNADLKFAKCFDAACTSPAPQKSIVDDGGGSALVGEYSRLAIAADGKPMVAYTDRTNDYLKFVKCGTDDCSVPASNSMTILDRTYTWSSYSCGVNPSLSLARGSDNLPVIGTHISKGVCPGGKFRMIHCGDDTCGGNPSGGGGVGTTFGGPVRISASDLPTNGSLYVQNTISSPAFVAASTEPLSGIATVNSSTTISITGDFRYGLYGQSSGLYGIDGYGQNAIGLYAQNSLSAAVNGAPSTAFAAARGDTLSQTGGAGVFGYSLSGGNGIEAHGQVCVAGDVVASVGRAGDESAAIYGRGGQYGGYFEGSVKLDDSNLSNNVNLYIGNTGVGYSQLKAMLDWCKTKVKSAGPPIVYMCPDAY
ncbi:MAG: hypothetical protein AAB490_00655 [Patescibacteria group bacterium]